MDKTTPSESNPFDQWRDECPKCHNRDCFTVFEFTDSTGKKRYPEARLHADGFDTNLPDAFVKKHGADTDEEKVRCDKCGEIFTLDELQLPEKCEKCGQEKRVFMHNCSCSSNCPEKYGCPECDDSCEQCAG